MVHDVADIQQRQMVHPEYMLMHYPGDRGLEDLNNDFALVQLGTISFLHVTSYKAIQETVALIPKSIDRDNLLPSLTYARVAS